MLNFFQTPKCTYMWNLFLIKHSKPTGKSCLSEIPDYIDQQLLAPMILCAIFSVLMLVSLILNVIICSKI